MGNNLIAEMSQIKVNLNSYKGYEPIAAALGKIVPQKIVAGLIGCIIPESGTNHRILNKKEYYGGGASGTSGWNCGEGLVQWTYWKYKEPLIKAYNADPRSKQKLPTTWSEYSKGQPTQQGNILIAPADGRHISGLGLDDQMLFLVLYYNDVIKKLANEENLAVIVAKIYQQKAGIGFFKNISDPVNRAYTTAKEKYKSSSGNHFLKSLKVAQQYMGLGTYPTMDNPLNDVSSYGGAMYASSNTGKSTSPNSVVALSSSNKTERDMMKYKSSRRDEFEALMNKMVSDTPGMGRNIMTVNPKDMYDSNILKGDQKSKIKRT